MKEITQKKEVIAYLKKHGSISSWDAIKELDVTRLSAVIYNIRRDGYNISTSTKAVETKYGKTLVAVYTLEESEE